MSSRSSSPGELYVRRTPETEHLWDDTMAHLVFSPRGYQLYTFLALEDVFNYARVAQVECGRRGDDPAGVLESVFGYLDTAIARARFAYVAAARQRFALDPALVHEVEPLRGVYQASGPTLRSCIRVRTLRFVRIPDSPLSDLLRCSPC